MGSALSWGWMVRTGWSLTPISWFILGTGIFFGFGIITGTLRTTLSVNAESLTDTFLKLTHANLINSTSVMIVLFIAALFAVRKQGTTPSQQAPAFFDTRQKWQICLGPLVLLIIALRFTFFPDVENLVLRSLLSKFYFFLPAAFVLLGGMFQFLSPLNRIFLISGFFLQILHGVLLFNKYEILMPTIALALGLLWKARSSKFVFATLLIPAAIYWTVNPLVSMGRLHHAYSASQNTLLERVDIVLDVLHAIYVDPTKPLNPSGTIRSNIEVASRISTTERLRSASGRFDIFSIQGYLIEEYDQGRPGRTLENAWSVLIPRVLWPEKPIITRFGYELSVQYYNDPVQGTSAMAPTYSGEAYWNKGWIGVFIVSAYLGICFGILSKIGLAARQRCDWAYIFVAYPLIISATFVESWIAATYIGGLAIIGIYYITIKMIFSKFGWSPRNA